MLLVRRALVLSGSHGTNAALPLGGVRSLRSGRRGVQRQVKTRPVPKIDDEPQHALHQPLRAALAVTRASSRRVARASSPAPVVRAPELPLVVLPPLIRVRDLAKALKLPLDDVLKRVATRAHRKLHMRWGDSRFEFKNVKQVIVPFEMAQHVAAHFGRQVAFDAVEPEFTTRAQIYRRIGSNCGGDGDGGATTLRSPVIAVMGHVDHGKTSLLDALRHSNIAARERHGITQKINVSDAVLTAQLRATFLDTPGHFHFFRMRTSAAQVADLVLLVVAADEGCGLQTDESIGALEDARIPVIACINKVDIATPEQIARVRHELRGYVALENCPIVEISATQALNLDVLKRAIAEVVDAPAAQRERLVDVGADARAEGVVLESVAAKGRGTVLRVLLRNGVLRKQDHFVAGMIHGAVRSLRNADGVEVACALPGTVVDVVYANKSKNVDAPNEFGFFALPEARAKQVMEQRQLALDIEETLLPGSNFRQHASAGDNVADAETVDAEGDDDYDDDDSLDDLNEDDLIETKSVIVKADGAGSLVSIQDTVDDMPGISTARIGIGNITTKDIDVAINGKCPIFGFNVKLHPKEKKLAAARGVRVILHSTIHGLIEDIAAFEKGDKESGDGATQA